MLYAATLSVDKASEAEDLAVFSLQALFLRLLATHYCCSFELLAISVLSRRVCIKMMFLFLLFPIRVVSYYSSTLKRSYLPGYCYLCRQESNLREEEVLDT